MDRLWKKEVEFWKRICRKRMKKLRAWSTGEGCLNNRSQRPQPCDLHDEDLERERSAERPTRAVVELVETK